MESFELNINWENELKKLSQYPQRQDSLYDQLTDLIKIANKFGLYDAADYLIKQRNLRPTVFV